MQRFILALWLGILLTSSTTWAYSGGTGEPNDPYQIATAQDRLVELRTSGEAGMLAVWWGTIGAAVSYRAMPPAR